MLLLDFDATFVSLQREVRMSDATALQDRNDVLHFGGELNSFSDTAAIMSNPHLVISVDTSVAHLAGALGKPVWLLCRMSLTGDGYSIEKTARGIRPPVYFGRITLAPGTT